jgi:beta-phosphoglucomutase
MLSWIHNFQLFLFDFDGLLVNTEHIHYAAYTYTISRYGIQLDIDFKQYCNLTHHSSTGFKEFLYENYPQLRENDSWNELYEQKRKDYVSMLQQQNVDLMPGATELLTELQKHGIQHCVVTHSPREQINLIKSKKEILQTIPYWFTREDYDRPKPYPDCYQHAIKTLQKDGNKIIGFEDTPRGTKAMLHTEAQPVIICKKGLYDLTPLLEKNVLHFETLNLVQP